MAKRLLSVLLVLSMVLSVVFALASCDPEDEFVLADSYTDSIYTNTVNGGSVTTEANGGATAGTVNTTPYAGETGKDYTDTEYYTYLDYISATTGLNWSPLSWETSDDSYVLGYLGMGFYDFALNEDLTGYSVVCEMASMLPIDVTEQYVGQYGVAEGDTAKAWLFVLNEDACWDDGTPITSADYIYSMQQQLDPLALYRRADSYYAGDFVLYNAKNYLYGGGTVFSTFSETGYTLDSATAAEKTVYIDVWDFWGLEGCVDADGNACPQYVSITSEVAWRDVAVAEGEDGDWISCKEIYEMYFAPGAAYESYGPYYLYTEEEAPAVTWDEVGLLATTYTDAVGVEHDAIVFIATAPVAQPEFYVPYYMSSTWLVKEDVFEASKTYYNAEGVETTKDAADVAKVVSNYCTTLANSPSYGPYKLTGFQADKEIVFERNENWYGYSDNNHLGQFQTDKIYCSVIADNATALLAFLQGELSGKGLQSTDMETYASSERLVYTPQSYTTKLTFNTNYESLVALGNNQQLLAMLEFRTAFGLAIDRQAFAAAYTSAGQAGFGLLNYEYCYDPFSGALYRDSDFAKQALVELFGLTYGGADDDYETLDEAYNAITGYDLDSAKALMQIAYDKAVDAGIYDGKSPVVLEFTVYNSEEIYVNMFNFFKSAIEAACVGTGFEGLVTLSMKEDNDYYNTMYAGNAAMIFSTWGGASMSPFTMIDQVYTDASDGTGNQMEYGYKTENINVTITVDGTDITATLKEWAAWCGNVDVAALDAALGKFADYSYDTRCAFFAIIEKVYLQGYATTSLYYRNSASLISYQIEYPTTTYLQLVGFGGIRYITYNYTDAEWATVKTTFDYTASAE